MSDTPETDAVTIQAMGQLRTAVVDVDFARKLERERDEWKAKFIQANKDYGFELMDPCGTIWDHAKRLQQELQDIKDAMQSAEKPHPDESHCGCVPLLRAALAEARGVLPKFRQKLLDQAATFKREDLRDNSRWSIFNEGRAQALEKMANELEGTK